MGSRLYTRIDNALNEARTLMLGAQVLVGFHFRAALQTRFESMSPPAHALLVIGLGLLILATGLANWPVMYHWLACQGRAEPRLDRFATRALSWALGPFAAGIGIDLYLAGEVVGGVALAIPMGACGGAVAGALWYILPGVQIRSHDMSEPPESTAPLTVRISQVLIELRVVLPGVQALLGFATIAVLMPGFEKLPLTLRIVHLVSLCLLAISVILLIAPVGYHRIAEHGAETERFNRIAGWMLIGGMAALAPALGADFWVVMEKVTGSRGAGLGGGIGITVLLFGMWFGWTWWRRDAGS